MRARLKTSIAGTERSATFVVKGWRTGILLAAHELDLDIPRDLLVAQDIDDAKAIRHGQASAVRMGLAMMDQTCLHWNPGHRAKGGAALTASLI
jgi:hypothetical protein